MGERPAGPGFQLVEERPDEAEQSAQESALPDISFGAFVLSLSTSALVHLGAAPLPGKTETEPPNLPLARQTIEILAMLEKKTKGNLDPDEHDLLESLLHDLRMRFVEVSRRGG